MCDALRELMKDDLEQARREGAQNALSNSIANVMVSLKLSAEQAMDALKIPAEEREFYRARL